MIKFFKRKKMGYFEILYQNIKILQEIAKARSRKKLMQHFEKNKKDFLFKDARLEAVFNLYTSRFKTRKLENLVAFLIKDMERFDFEHTSSVPQKFEPQYSTYQNRYDKLRGVNLLSHTIRVFVLACEKRKDMPDIFMEQIAVLALAHDFGKNAKVIELASEGRQEKHNQISAKYLGLVMRGMGCFNDDLIDSLTTTLFFHHPSNIDASMEKRVVSNTYIELLNECDGNAREIELRSIEKSYLAKKQDEIMKGRQQ